MRCSRRTRAWRRRRSRSSTLAADSWRTTSSRPFFPAYTDHGCAHVGAVLDAAVRLIPVDVWRTRVLTPSDAAVLACATLLHDLAMHVREHGFVELVSGSAGFAPCAWFDQPQGDRAADAPWPALWQSFRKEARHLTKSQLDRLLGSRHAGVPAVAFGEKTSVPENWAEADRLLIGEFLRRHHARLAHEIALNGFPGLRPNDFPRLHEQVPHLADAIGVVARSHNEPLRTVLAYLAYRHPGNQRPAGAVLPYLMGLLRIADYFQIDGGRAPALLLHLREPHSAQSLDEWRKHQAIAGISWDHQDPDGVYVDVLPSHGLRTHLQLSELLADLQREMDVTTAVLSETYPAAALSSLRLARRRVHTNLDKPSLHAQLGFVPRRAALRSAEDLFRLVIGDLYGDEPAVAGRELLQNAVDAVRERRRWEASGGVPSAGDLRDQEADVVVELRMHANGDAMLRVVDRGIGMRADTVVEHFLTAGASFGPAHDDAEALESGSAVAWMKAGRFGVGAFAAFLLGAEMHVRTRHVEAARGFSFTASLDRDLIQLDWTEDLPVGTEVTVPLSREVMADRSSDSLRRLLEQIAHYYVLDDPEVAFRLDDVDGGSQSVQPDFARVPTSLETPPPHPWRRIVPDGFDAVLWRPERHMSAVMSHNGIGVHAPKDTGFELRKPRGRYAWSRHALRIVRRPRLAVFDSRHRLGVSLNRYDLTSRVLPFEEDLLRSIGEDLVAHALAVGPEKHPLGADVGLEPVFTADGWVPLHGDLVTRHLDTELCALWTMLSEQPNERMARFVDDRAGGWDAFPNRAAPGWPADGEPRRRRMSVPTYEASMRTLMGSFNMVQTAQLALIPQTAAFAQVRERFQPNSLRLEVTALRLAEVPFACFARGRRDVVDRLLELACNLVVPDVDAVVLTVMRFRGDPESPPDPLAIPWTDLLGGPLERDAASRSARAAELCAAHPWLHELVDGWLSTQPIQPFL